MSCGYQGYEFGAGYLDSVCVGGRLFDADNCDDSGNLYEPLDDIPCPQCSQVDAMHYYADSNQIDADCRSPRYYAWHLVADIRKNRGLRSMALLTWLTIRLWWELRDWLWRAGRGVLR